jgi:hypothetical protein
MAISGRAMPSESLPAAEWISLRNISALVREISPGLVFRPVALCTCGIGVFFAFLAEDAGARQDGEAIEALVYDYAVMEHCGLLNNSLEQIFLDELERLTQESGLSREKAKKARLRGWVAADREYDNRGLGGHRAWCQEDGGAARVRFEGLGEKAP